MFQLRSIEDERRLLITLYERIPYLSGTTFAAHLLKKKKEEKYYDSNLNIIFLF